MNVQRTILDGYFTIGGLTTLLALAGSVLGIFTYLRKMRRENEQDARERLAEQKRDAAERFDEIKDILRDVQVSLGERVKALETTTADFVSRKEIEAKIEHEKANRATITGELSRRLDKSDADTRDLMVKVAALTQRQDGMSADMTEIKALLKEQGRDLKDIAAQMRTH